tara:strand:+ start:2467 stop:2754 length:288 start_codon:yes stop_codon:yes gene_type:complete
MKDVKVEDIAQDVKKITDEELKEIQEMVNGINQMQMQIGGLDIQKGMIMDQVKAAQVELQVKQKELEDKYGKVSVSLVDGSIKEIPEEDESDKKN